jgi:hypothetical protein
MSGESGSAKARGVKNSLWDGRFLVNAFAVEPPDLADHFVVHRPRN